MRRSLAAAVTFSVVGLSARLASAEPACTAPKTTCAGNGGYYASTEDLDRLKAVSDPLLRDLRTCLDTNGAKHVTPVLMMRWNSDGRPVEVKIDVPGYESLPCVASASKKLSSLENPHETSIRCEFGCAKPAPPAPVPAPVVVPPVPPAKPAAPATTPAPTSPAPVATTPTTPAPPPPRYEKTWYGWQTLIADGASVGVLLVGTGVKSGGAVAAGIVGFALATPIVHMVHGNIGPGFGSIGIRLLLPLTGLGVGAIAGLIAEGTSGSGDFGAFGSRANGAVNGAVIGGLIGVAGCVAIDAAGLAWKKERVDDQAAGGPKRVPELTLAPVVDVQKTHATFGVGGSF